MPTAVAPCYADRIGRLAERKVRQTREKVARNGFMDVDDHGTVALPDDFHWEATPNHPCGSFFGAKGWADNFRSLMEVHPTFVDPDDALAGRWRVYLTSHRKVHWNPDFDYSHLLPDQQRYGIIPGIGAMQHFAPDFTIGLELGWGGLLAKIRRYRAQHGADRAEFYQAEEDVVIGVQTWIRRTIDAIHAAEQAETNAEARENLRQQADVNEWIVENPPRTLREACQWMAWFNMASRIYDGDGAGGQLDELLRPYYQADRAAGRIDDDEEAIWIIACLLLNDPQYYQIGGPDAQGNDVTSHVSFLILEAAHRLGIPCNITIRVHDGLNEELFRRSVRHLLEDRKNWPRYSGDKGLMGFTRNGYSEELARQRIAVGCHWMAIPGREYTANDCVKINVGKVFEAAFWEMMEAAEAAPSVAELWSRFQTHLRRAIRCTAEGLDFHLAHMKDVAPELLLNLLCHGPIEKGRDVSDGGVEFYNMCIDGSALATVADSFGALEQRIEREGVLTWPEIARRLRENWEGPDGERVRQMMKHSGRYGHGGTLGDAWAVRISRRFTELVKEAPTPGGRNLIPGWFSWSNTISMGRELSATPNGRRSGDPISHGANPDPGFRKDGAPTAMAQAIAAVQPGYGNTCPMQLELDPGTARDAAAVDALASLIKSHFALGGTLFNVNIVDGDTIRAAHKNPEAFPDLVVRVTGFTAYFASLSPAFRQLVVDRLIEEA